MAYVAPTAADLKARFPAFNAVDNAVVTQALAEAARLVDQKWSEGDFQIAQMLYASHVMTLDGLGTEAAANVDLPYGVKSMKAGGSQLQRFASADPGVAGYSSTSYGKRFTDLMRVNIGGTIVV